MAKFDYRDQLRGEFDSMIGEIELPDLQKRFMRSRWLDQVLWMEGQADKAQQRYRILRMTTIVGGVIVPGLISLDLACSFRVFRYAVLGLSLLVAISAGLEEFLNYAERWRHYRQTVEWLKTEGWQFLTRTGPYRRYRAHANAYPLFAGRVEELMQRDIGEYFAKVMEEQNDESANLP